MNGDIPIASAICLALSQDGNNQPWDEGTVGGVRGLPFNLASGVGCCFLILLKKSPTKNDEKFFTHKCPTIDVLRMVNHF